MVRALIRGRTLGLAVAALAVAGLGAPTPASSATSADQAGKSVAKTFGVLVLKVKPATFDGRKVFVVTVMNPKGDFNEAFLVSTVVVDAASGKLVSGFRHRSAKQIPNQAPSYIPNRQVQPLREGLIWR